MHFGHHYLYIVRCADGSLFTGTTDDIDRAVREMNAGIGNPYIRTRGPVFLAYTEEFMNERDAERRAADIKRMDRSEKERVVSCTGLAGLEFALVR